MAKISENEFERICRGIFEDRESICKHNPIGPRREILLWMLLSCLISYLSLTEKEIPCFTDTPDAETYEKAILYILSEKSETPFEAGQYFRDF